MPLCQSCQSLPVRGLRSSRVFFPNYGGLVKGSAEDCDGCRFFSDVINIRMKQNKSTTWQLHPGAFVSLSDVWRRGWCAVLQVNNPIRNMSASTQIFQRSVQIFKQSFLIP